MGDIIGALLNGLTLVSVLALTSLGLAIVFGLMRVINMAHGELLAIGAYLLVLVEKLGGSFWLALVFAPILGAVVGLLVEKLVLRERYDNPVAVILSTWGLSLVLQQSLQIGFGNQPFSISPPIPGTFEFLGTRYPAYRLFLILAAMLLVAAGWVLHGSRYGVNLRALIQDRNLAKGLGVDVIRTSQMAFVCATALSVFCGVLVAPQIVVVAQLGVNYLARSFVVVIVGGAGNPLGLLWGSGLLGTVETLLGEIHVPATLAQAAVLFVVILVVKIRLTFKARIAHV